MSKVSWQAGSMVCPVPPTLVSCGTMEKPNAITIAWTGILNTQPPKTYISVRPERFSYNLIKESGEFVINLPTAKLVKAIDYCGCRSGAKEDKFKATGITPMESGFLSCPQVAESPINIACKVVDIVPLGTHHMFIADIIGVNVEETLIDKNGKLHLDKAGLMCYAHGEYFALGEKVGSFGFSVKKAKKKR